MSDFSNFVRLHLNWHPARSGSPALPAEVAGYFRASSKWRGRFLSPHGLRASHAHKSRFESTLGGVVPLACGLGLRSALLPYTVISCTAHRYTLCRDTVYRMLCTASLIPGWRNPVYRYTECRHCVYFHTAYFHTVCPRTPHPLPWLRPRAPLDMAGWADWLVAEWVGGLVGR